MPSYLKAAGRSSQIPQGRLYQSLYEPTCTARLDLHFLWHCPKQGGQTNPHAASSSNAKPCTQHGSCPTPAPQDGQAVWKHLIGQGHSSSHGIGQVKTDGSLGLAVCFAACLLPLTAAWGAWGRSWGSGTENRDRDIQHLLCHWLLHRPCCGTNLTVCWGRNNVYHRTEPSVIILFMLAGEFSKEQN